MLRAYEADPVANPLPRKKGKKATRSRPATLPRDGQPADLLLPIVNLSLHSTLCVRACVRAWLVLLCVVCASRACVSCVLSVCACAQCFEGVLSVCVLSVCA